MNLILPFCITYIACQLHRPPLEAVVAKQSCFLFTLLYRWFYICQSNRFPFFVAFCNGFIGNLYLV